MNSIRLAPPPRQKQVMLKVRFAQVDRSKLTAFGINLFSTGAANTLGTISTQQFAPPQLVSTESGGKGVGWQHHRLERPAECLPFPPRH